MNSACANFMGRFLNLYSQMERLSTDPGYVITMPPRQCGKMLLDAFFRERILPKILERELEILKDSNIEYRTISAIVKVNWEEKSNDRTVHGRD